MSLRTAAETLGQILDRYRASKGWQAKSDDDHKLDVAAWLEILEVSGVPIEHYESCYKAARQAQVERAARGEEVLPLSADDLAVEWIKIRNLHDEMEREGGRVKMLAENAASQCQRCFGKKPFVDSCDHRPLTDAEREEQARINAAEAKRIREGMKAIGSPRPVAREPEPAPAGFWLVCDSCGHKYNFMKRQEGDKCGYLLDRYTDPHVCEGTMRKV